MLFEITLDIQFTSLAPASIQIVSPQIWKAVDPRVVRDHRRNMDSPMETDYKCSEPDLQLDVDILMLDYLLHAAVVSVLQDRRSQQSGALAATEWTDKTERAIDSVDCEFRPLLSLFHSSVT